MRKILLSFVLMLCIIFVSGMAIYAAAVPQYRRTSTITIRVDDVEAAAAVISHMAGQNISAEMNLGEVGFSSASFERRVPAGPGHLMFMQQLRELGEVISEAEFTQYQGEEIRRLETQLSANAVEIERLMSLMSNASTLNILMTIDQSLSRAERERDFFTGRLNYLRNVIISPYVVINLVETLPEPLIIYIDEPSFGQRMGDAFVGSIEAILAGAGHFVVFLTFAAIPLAFLGAVAFATVKIARKYIKPKSLAASPVHVEEIVNEEDE